MADKTPWIDPIIEEIRRHSDEYAVQFDYDLEAIFLDLQRRQEEEGGEVVDLSRKTLTER